MEVQKCVHLLHDWLREHGLHDTCAALRAEFGTLDTNPLNFSLDELFEAVSAILNVFGLSLRSCLSSTAASKAKAKPATRKRKVCVSKEKAPPKPKTTPAVDWPWVCPEMESILCAIYDRNNTSAPPSTIVISPDTTENDEKVDEASGVDAEEEVLVAKSTEGAGSCEGSEPDSKDETLPKANTSKPLTPASTPQKKKKKFSAMRQLVVAAMKESIKTDLKKKKKKKTKAWSPMQGFDEEEQTTKSVAVSSKTTVTETVEEVSADDGKKKKLKRKRKSVSAADLVLDIGTTPIRKKSNKPKKLYTVEPFIDSPAPFIDSPAQFGVLKELTPKTNIDNKLALSTLGQSLKKKKKNRTVKTQPGTCSE